MKVFKKRLRNIFYIVFLVLLVVVIGYFVTSCNRLNNKGVGRDYFNGKMYQSFDNTCFLSFTAEGADFVYNEVLTDYTVMYEENIFKLEAAGEVLYFMVIDENTLYSDKYNEYLYYLG